MSASKVPGRGSSGLSEAVKANAWYHTIDLGDGVVTQGMFDHRSHVAKYRLPDDMSGMRCLDVGTMDGFWAFEMERRGAAEVVAVDVPGSEELDWPVLVKPQVPDKSLDEAKDERFALVKTALGSNVKRVMRSVYDLDEDLGKFDVVFCGDLLVHLKDPVSALEAMLRVTSGKAIVCTPIVRTRFYSKKPMVHFDGVEEFQWWTPNRNALARWMTAAGYSRVEVSAPFEVPLVTGEWRGLRGVAVGHAGGSRPQRRS